MHLLRDDVFNYLAIPYTYTNLYRIGKWFSLMHHFNCSTIGTLIPFILFRVIFFNVARFLFSFSPPAIQSKVKSNKTSLSFPKDACHRLLKRTQNKLDLCTSFLLVSNPQYDVDLLSSKSEKKLLPKKAIAGKRIV